MKFTLLALPVPGYGGIYSLLPWYELVQYAQFSGIHVAAIHVAWMFRRIVPGHPLYRYNCKDTHTRQDIFR